MAKKVKKVSFVTPGANPEHVRADQARRRSGAAGPHVQGTRGARTRKGAKAAAIRDSRGW